MDVWKCLKCGRQFKKQNQSHSCAVYSEKEHFAGRQELKPLYDEYKRRVRRIGRFRVDAPRCCIHFVKDYTFAGTYVMKDKLRVFFELGRNVKSPRFVKAGRTPSNRYTYLVDVRDSKDFDKELIGWIGEAYHLR